MTETRGALVITGAGRGLGAALARHFSGIGWPLAICARTSMEINAVAREIRARGEHAGLVVGQLDVTEEKAVRDFAEHVGNEIGPARAVVNNAGVLGPVGAIDEVDLDAWRHALDVNVVGVVNTVAAFVPQMDSAGGGAFINLSGAGIGGPGTHSHLSAYTSSKAAIAVLTEVLAKELFTRGIRVNAIAPGALATGLMREVMELGPRVAGEELFSVASSIYRAGSSDRVEIDDRLADLVSFLLSDESDWLTGKLLSARWDPVGSLRAMRKQLSASSLLTLRRIDDVMFTEKP